MVANGFLADFDLRDVTLPPGCPFRLGGLALGQGPSPLEVLAVAAGGVPSAPKVRSLWKERSRGRAAPMLLVVLFDDRAVFCGPAAAGGDPPVHAPVERAQAERLCVEALEQPDRHAAHRYLRDALPAVVDSPMPGLRNEGLLATHELAHGARHLPVWGDAGARARPILARREEARSKRSASPTSRWDRAIS